MLIHMRYNFFLLPNQQIGKYFLNVYLKISKVKYSASLLQFPLVCQFTKSLFNSINYIHGYI